jgi:Na+-transporting NADH:ubiquinone oxidoreductase subunit A
MIKIRKGLDLPIAGAPERLVEPGSAVRSVAVLGEDFPGMKPTMLVTEGDHVEAGEPLFTDKKNPRVHYTAPAAGTIKVIHRGAKRALQSVVIDVDDELEPFTRCEAPALADVDRPAIVDSLLLSGLWPALRTRPVGRSRRS